MGSSKEKADYMRSTRKEASMKRLLLFTVLFSICLSGQVFAFSSGSTGADGALNPTSNTVLQVPASGTFNFTTVNIPSGVTVKFTPNVANTPVTMLTTGDVTIAGTIDVSGVSANNTTGIPGIGGPGGYSGGYAGNSSTGTPAGIGLGPGGGPGGTLSCTSGTGGSYGTLGVSCYSCAVPAATYGYVKLIPLLGGSGGGGMVTSNGTQAGGGGGGALLIASSGNITITGSILANGGSGYDRSGSGSGGGIRLITNTISGNGTISATGGQWNSPGGNGRIRIEATTNNFTSGTNPPYSFGSQGSVFPSNIPSLTISTVNGYPPTNQPPTGSYAAPDITLPNTTTNPIIVNVSAQYIPVGSTVTVSVLPQYGSSNTSQAILSGTLQSSTASAEVNLSTQYSNVIMAQVSYTITAMYYNGEKIVEANVKATPGRESETTYISESGKKIKAQELLMAGLIQ